MPTLGAFIENGTLTEWKVKPGQRVKRGEIVAVVDTDKAAIDIETFQDGVIVDLVAQPGEKLPVGAVLAHIAEDGAPGAVAEVSGHVRASPAARQRAQELGVAIEQILGTGPDGAVTLADVERAAPGQPVAPSVQVAAAPQAAVPEATPMRRAIALAMERSNREVPHYHLAVDLEMTRALAWLGTWNATHPLSERVLPVALLIKAVALAIAETPELNGFWEEGAFRPGQDVHVGVVIWLRQGGLVVPALHDVARKPLAVVMADLADLTNRARAGRLTRTEITEGTVTVTSLGDRGATLVHGVIFPPQVALVGFGRLSPRPWVENGQLVVREAVTTTLAADHRASDGRTGSAFLETLGRLLLEPEAL